MRRRDPWRQLRGSAWLVGGTLGGGTGSFITGTGDHPLRHILPDALNYFQHSGNMLWGGLLGTVAVGVASVFENRRKVSLSAGKFAAAAMLSGLVVGGVANAAFETHVGYRLVGENLGLQGGKTQDPWGLVWGAGFAGLVAAGLGGDLRRYDLKQSASLMPDNSLPVAELPPAPD